MSTADEKRQLLEAVLATAARSKDDLFQLFAPEACFYEPESLPYGGEYHGPERFAEFNQTLADTWSELAYDVKDILASDTRAATFGVATFTSRATGRSVTFTLCEVWEFAGGKVVRVDAIYGDTVAVLDALGVEPRRVPDEPD